VNYGKLSRGWLSVPVNKNSANQNGRKFILEKIKIFAFKVPPEKKWFSRVCRPKCRKLKEGKEGREAKLSIT